MLKIFSNHLFILYREDKLKTLCIVMGIKQQYEPDLSYELPTDIVKEILVICMRLREAIYQFKGLFINLFVWCLKNVIPLKGIVGTIQATNTTIVDRIVNRSL